jgi:hypothetical protein
MVDFFQNGEITNLHRLTAGDTERLEKELEEFSKRRSSLWCFRPFFRPHRTSD